MWRWFRIGLAGAAALLLLLAVWTPTHRQGPPAVSRSVTLSEFDSGRALARAEEAPSLLVDRDNPRLVYLSDVDLTTGACRFSVSLDGGRTWRKENPPLLDPYTRNCALGSGRPQNVRTQLVQASDEGRLFGSVGRADLATFLAQHGIEIERRRIALDEPIKSLGEFTVPVRLHADVTAQLKVSVSRE